MKKFLGTLLWICCCSVALFAEGNMLEKLKQIPQVSDIQELKVDSFEEYYQFWFEQPVDHNDPSKGTFKQKVLLGHKKQDAPVVAELEGYNIWTQQAGELTKLFNANQLTVEHRFFDESVPAGGIPWEYLTIRQAAIDHHEIIQAIKTHLYPRSKWISTGISKGGQTTIFHRYFYPEDVDVSVPYVAPLNLEYIDPRLESFLEKLGANRLSLTDVMTGGSTQRDCRWSIRDFQNLCFKNLDKLTPMLEEFAQDNGYTYQRVGGVERALKLIILEYPFAFWQWGNSCDEIPEPDTQDMNLVFDYLIRISTPDFFEDKYIVKMQPFFYAALTEIGMYAYNPKPFKKYFKGEKVIDFSFTMPDGVEKKPFNAKQIQAINKWLQTDAKNILLIYGGKDPWYATAVDPKGNWNCRRYVAGDLDHKCRIKDFDPVSKEDLIETLKGWLKVKK